MLELRSPCALMVALALLTLPSCTREAATPRGAATGETSIAVVEAVESEAFVLHAADRIAAAPGLRLLAGDRLETGAPGKMRVRLTDDTVLAIGAGTKVALAELTADQASRRGRIDVAVGRFWMNVTRWTGSGESSYEISTPNAVAGVRGTTLWGDTEVDAICALEGSIEVRSVKTLGAASAALTAGNCASELREGKLTPLAPTAEQIGRFLDEVLIRPK